jgi:threonine dehydratase
MPVMADSFDGGQPPAGPVGKTIADGLAVRVAIPLAVAHLRHAVDVMVRVSEREIAEALVAYAEGGIEVEPSAAAAQAALFSAPRESLARRLPASTGSASK